MKKILLLLVIAAAFINCNYPFDHELKAGKENDTELQAIEQSGKSFYDWLFKEDFVYLGVIQDKNGKCLLDTVSYFNQLKKLGTISEKFFIAEKERLSGCAQFISTVKYAKYMKSLAYAYAEECPEFYFLYWVNGQIVPESYSVKNVKMINATQATMDIHFNFGDVEEPSTQIRLEKENDNWKIVAVNFLETEE